MIEYKHGDILEADVDALVNTVNCVGVMGRGVALQFRKAFEDNYRAYRKACERGELEPGVMLVYEVQRLGNPRFIINFPTKRHWRGKSRIKDIEAGLSSLVEEVRERNIESIAIPPLGCGLGGLKWNDVRPLIEDAFAESPEVRVLVYEPCGAPAADKMVRSPKKPRMTHGRAALLGLMRRYLAAVMDPQITLLEIHKLMFFMQESGEPLKLRYTKGPYGPYAENLRHVLNLLEGHYICGYGDAEDDPNREIELMPRAAEQAEVYLADHPDTRQRFNRVVDLISGFESSYGMELLTTVDWVCRREGARTLEEAVDKTWAWNDRKRMFPEQHIVSAWETLRQQGWLATESCGNGGEGHGSSR